MAEAPPLDTLNPKQLGKHLRAVRRRKGLSQSEVARGAGLTRRELNAYEKGRIPIPDSDLFVIAGSCGVDVSELRATPPPQREIAPVPETPAPVATDLPMPSTIEDTVAQLRRSQEVAPPAPAMSGRRRARAIEAASAPVDTSWQSTEDDWSIERIDPLDAVPWPTDASIDGSGDSASPSPAQPIDVFEELARLSDAPPLPPPGAFPGDTSGTDFFGAISEAPIPPPPGAVEGFDDQPYDDEWPAFESDYESDTDPEHAGNEAEPVLVEMPTVQSTIADVTSAADAPPIDVAMRGESYDSPWDALQSTSEFSGPGSPPDVSDVWEPVLAAPEPEATAFDVQTDGWTTEIADPLGAAPVEVFDPRFATAAPFEAPTETWTHEPDPEATSTGFYVDWGDPDADTPASGDSELGQPEFGQPEFGQPESGNWEAAEPEPEPWAAFAPPAFADATAEADVHPVDVDAPSEPHDSEALSGPDAYAAPVTDVESELVPNADADDGLPLISWRPQWDDSPDAAIGVIPAVDESFEPEPEPEHVEQFAVAGSEWVLGNAVPLVEVRSSGSLVMRRADERWALADVTAASDFALEAYVDLRSGPGFGLLFRAMIDDDGRMSGYSFDVDPVYEGGSYLVREWRADRELWNPVARVPAPEPDAMHGLLAVRLTVDDDRLVAAINGETVLEVDSLKQASADRGREGACGDRVGIQAWSSTDLVIDELRVAQH